MPSKFFFDQKKNDFLTKMVKNNIFSQKLAFFVSILQSVCFKDFFLGALHVCRSKIGDVENSFHTRHIFESQEPRGCS